MGIVRSSALAVAALLALSTLAVPAPARAVAGPANDFFAFAKPVSTLPFTDAAVDTALATKEPGEPDPTCSAPGASLSSYGNSVWYAFVAPLNTTLSAAMLPASTVSNSISPVISAYSGTSLGALVNVGCAFASAQNAKTSLAFTVSAGTTYYVRAASNSNASSGGVFDFTLVDKGAPPAPSSLASSFVAGKTVASGSLPVTFSWTGKAGSAPIGHYDVETSCDGGAWSAPASQTANSRTVNVGVPGHSCSIRVQTVDALGRYSPWATSANATPTAYQESSTAIRYRGMWSTASSSSFSGGRARRASAAAASVTFTFTGRSVAWTGLRCASCGSVKVYVKRGSGAYTYVATVSTRATTSSYRRFIWTKTWSTSATRTVKLVVLGTSGHPRVYVDLFAKLR